MLTKKSNAILRWAMVGLCMLIPALVFAEAGTADEILQAANDEIYNLSDLIINIVSLVMGLVGAVMLGVNLYKYFKGDPSSNDALMKIGGGILIAVVLLQVIRVTLIN